MSSEIQSKNAVSVDLPDLGATITVYYVDQHRGVQGITGDITSIDSDKLVVESHKPNHPPIMYVAKCKDHWDDEITVCSQDWRRLGPVLMITNNKCPVYCAPTDEI